ncbi:hypothetical protein NHX12_032006, partial [Muraenolepis orangiensis]
MKRPFSPTVLRDPELDLPDRGISSSSSSTSLAVMAVLGGQMLNSRAERHHLLLHHHHHHHQQLHRRTEGGAARGERPAAGAALPPAPHRAKRERKQRSYTLCEVCNIQLNSPAQAHIHDHGKAHQKRLRQVSSARTPPSSAST